MKKIILITFIFLISSFNNLISISNENSLVFSSTMSFLTLSNVLYNKTFEKKLTSQEIEKLRTKNINRFDRTFTGKYLEEYNKYSNYSLFLTACPTIYALYDDHSTDNLLNFAKIISTQTALSLWTKSIVKRKRPYVYSSKTPYKFRIQKDSQHSFFSFHASLSFSLATFNYLESDQKIKNIPFFYTPAIFTSIFRVKARKHFPSDVIIGAIVGIGFTYILY